MPACAMERLTGTQIVSDDQRASVVRLATCTISSGTLHAALLAKLQHSTTSLGHQPLQHAHFPHIVASPAAPTFPMVMMTMIMAVIVAVIIATASGMARVLCSVNSLAESAHSTPHTRPFPHSLTLDTSFPPGRHCKHKLRCRQATLCPLKALRLFPVCATRSR
jgi:hypothetical protein